MKISKAFSLEGKNLLHNKSENHLPSEGELSSIIFKSLIFVKGLSYALSMILKTISNRKLLTKLFWPKQKKNSIDGKI